MRDVGQVNWNAPWASDPWLTAATTRNLKQAYVSECNDLSGGRNAIGADVKWANRLIDWEKLKEKGYYSKSKRGRNFDKSLHIKEYYLIIKPN